MKVVRYYELLFSVALLLLGCPLARASQASGFAQAREPLSVSLQEYSPISAFTHTRTYNFQSSSHVSSSSSSSTSSADVAYAPAVSVSPKTQEENQVFNVVYCKFCLDLKTSCKCVYAVRPDVLREFEQLFGIAELNQGGNGTKERPLTYQFTAGQDFEYAAALVAAKLLEEEAVFVDTAVTMKEMQDVIDGSEVSRSRMPADEVCAYITYCFFVESALNHKVAHCGKLREKISSCLMREYIGWFKNAVEPGAFVEQLSNLGNMLVAYGEEFSARLKNQSGILNTAQGTTFVAYSFDLLRGVLKRPKEIKDIISSQQADRLLRNLERDDSLSSIQSLPAQRLNGRVVVPRSFSGPNSANSSLKSNSSRSPLGLSPRLDSLGSLGDGSLPADYQRLTLSLALPVSDAPAAQVGGTEEAALLGRVCCLKRFWRKHPRIASGIATLLTAGVGCGAYCLYAYTNLFKS